MYCGVPSDNPVCVIRVPAGIAHRQRNAEIGDHRLARLEQDVLRLEVAMDHVVPVRVVERVAPPRPRCASLRRSAAASRDPVVAQRFAFDERHHVEQQPVRFARIEQRQQVGMLQVGGDA